ncbi:hypothetical protein EG329_013578 [Mollisiaceae sp. DMI_Dod_QoI]|nr:hypothetical protein EG329_013578 [Helotiales sp. DMI_Dod_QoI]
MVNDKLIALSGVASTLQNQFDGSQYLAGLWRDDLRRQLKWYITDPLKTRLLFYRAPSWSWASLDSSVLMRYMRSEYSNYLVEVLEAVTKPLGADPTGQVESGYVQLSGPLLTVSLRRSAAMPRKFEIHVCGSWHSLNPSEDIWPDIDEKPPENLHAIPFNDNDYCDYLLVYPTNGRMKKGTFKRWGMMQLSYGDWDISKGDGWRIQWNEVKNEEWLEFEEDLGNGRYVVTII